MRQVIEHLEKRIADMNPELLRCEVSERVLIALDMMRIETFKRYDPVFGAVGKEEKYVQV
jgi:hypothetical protein